MHFGLPPGGRFSASNVPALELIRAAYNITDFQIVDAPNWTRAKRFDIVAKGSASAGPAQVFLMLRALLAERFRLAVHIEKREMPVYALVKAGGSLGPRLGPTAADCATIMAGVRRGLPAPRRPMRVVLHCGAEQLGLKLEPTRPPVDVLVVDRVERPSGD